jgi:hypothetical protein
MYDFIAYLSLSVVFVVAHVGQEGPNCAKGNNKIQKVLYILSKKHLQCEASVQKALHSNGVVHKVINIFCFSFIKHLLDNQASHAADKRKSIY